MKQRSVRILGVLLSIVLLICLAGPGRVMAAQDTESLTLSDSQPEENQSFQLANMVPGQSETKIFRVEIIHTKEKTVSFRAGVSEGSKKLAEALAVTVKRMDTREVLYDGTLSEMSWVDWTVVEESVLTLEEMVYEVTFTLPDTATLDCQGEKVTVRLDWQMEQVGGGNAFWLWFCIIGGVIALGALAAAFILIRKSKLAKEATQVVSSIILVVALVLGWSVTSYALSWHQITVDENIFSTGTLKINLNDGNPVFDEDILFEPGMLVQRHFTIANEGSIDAYYRLWFSEIEGDLAEELIIELRDGKKMIFEGEFKEMLEEKSFSANSTLLAGEEKELSVVIFLPEEGTNASQGKTVTFRMNYDATQKESNPGKEYGLGSEE